MSGTGKSSALAELGRRGFRVVDTDDPGWREYREYVESSDEVRRDVDVFHPQPVGLAALEERVRAGFDPKRVLNRGRMRRIVT